MPVAINFKICDNAEECNGIEVCPTGALSWDDKRKTIVIDNTKCTSCGACERSCMVQAIKVGRTKEEFAKIQKEIEEDSRKVSDLYLDRYGAMPILPAFLIEEDKFEREVLKASKLTAVEVFENEGIMCLLKSIPITELFDGLDIKFRKMEIKNKKFLDDYDIKELPALLFFLEGKLAGKVEGYFENENKQALKKKIKVIIG